MARKFKLTKGARGMVPIWVGASGPSGGGKTYSLLRLATGIQAVAGGSIAVIDTEARRALHYNDLFVFEHLAMDPPFGSLDYLAAIQYCWDQGHRIIITDSMSHEHSGAGGLLDFHESELDRLGGTDPAKRERVKMLAWQQPKKARDRLISTLLQMEGHFLFSFRAKPTVKPVKVKGKIEMVPQGYMPTTGDEWPFEMTINLLLPPAADGLPSWESEYAGEKSMMKLPVQFRELFLKDPRPLDEDHGRKLAEWARGGAKVEKATEAVAEVGQKEALILAIGRAFREAGLNSNVEEEADEIRACIRDFFGARSREELEVLDVETLQAGYAKLQQHLKVDKEF